MDNNLDQNKNQTKAVVWSIVAIIVGVTFSSLVINFLSRETKPIASTAEVISEPTVPIEEDKEPSKAASTFLAFLEKFKNFTLHLTSKGAVAFSTVDFDKLILPPQANYYLKDKDLLPKVGAAAYVVGDVDTGEIILEKDSDKTFPIASVTKLMTALVSLEDLDQESFARVSNKAYETLGTSGQLRSGEKMKVSDLLYPLLLVSSNDAAEVLSEESGRPNFLRLMNETAKSIGMINTNYEDPSGLSSHNYSTGEDLFNLAHYLFTKHKTVFDITGLDKFSLGNRTWNNANRFSYRDDYIGGKTGYTDLAKRTGVAIFSEEFEGYGKRNIGIILLKTDNRTEDINNILTYLQKNVYLSYEDETKKQENEVTLGFVGDVMLDRGVKTSIYKNFSGDFDKIFAKADFLKDPDIMFANLEGPISDKGHNVGSKYSFRMEPAAANAIKNSGIDIVSFANNHVGDYSTEAFADTLGRLKEANILYAGAGMNYPEASTATIIERNGTRIGYLAVSDVGPEWLKATDKAPGLLLANDPKLVANIAEAKKSVDVLIVSAHWGEEYKPHTTRQEMLAKKMIDAGADIVVGSHPHVMQDVASYKDGLIIYSLGNFVFDQSFSSDTMQGLYEEVTINKDGVVSHKETTFKLNGSYQPYIEDAKKETPESIFAQGSCPIGNEDANYNLYDSNLENSVGKYVPGGLVEITDVIPTKEKRQICLTEDTATHLKELRDAALKDGVSIIVTSGFRSYGTQETLYANNQLTHSDDDDESVAKPGHSEHQLGTTVDLTSPEISQASAAAEFKGTSEYTWLSKNAYKYGFVMSYPSGADTGYIFEPWHWRYLGEDAAEEIKESGLTTQHYLESL